MLSVPRLLLSMPLPVQAYQFPPKRPQQLFNHSVLNLLPLPAGSVYSSQVAIMKLLVSCFPGLVGSLALTSTLLTKCFKTGDNLADPSTSLYKPCRILLFTIVCHHYDDAQTLPAVFCLLICVFIVPCTWNIFPQNLSLTSSFTSFWFHLKCLLFRVPSLKAHLNKTYFLLPSRALFPSEHLLQFLIAFKKHSCARDLAQV